jgi:acyl-CoA thioester hydrolase
MEIYTRKVHYYETDQMGIVHHSNYIRWFEEARIDMLDKMGLPMDKIEQLGVQIPVLSVTCNYRNMTRFNDIVSVGLKIEKYNGIKMKISYEIRNIKTNEITNTGSSEHCFLDMKGNVVSIKKSFPQMHEIFIKNEGLSTY